MEWMFPEAVLDGEGCKVDDYQKMDLYRKVVEEYNEWLEEFNANKDSLKELEEMLDLLHSIETYLRKNYREESIKAMQERVVLKNLVRGYYGKEYVEEIKPIYLNKNHPIWFQATTKE